MLNQYIVIDEDKVCTLETAKTLVELIEKIDEEINPHFVQIFHIDPLNENFTKIESEEVTNCLNEIFGYKE